ncbi:MAG: response regulator [Algicola sp.]|nr:response regulator [Algicola sp.]
MKVEHSSSSVRIWISISFAVLAIALELTMASYWSNILEPRLKSQAKTNAQLLAQSQAIALANVLSRIHSDVTAKQQVQGVFDNLLLIKDPSLDAHFFVAITLEVDYDVVTVTPELLNLSQGDKNCLSCFEAPVELYSTETDELLGIAIFYVSDVFFRSIKTDLKDRFIVEGVIVFALLLLLWIVVITLVRSLYRNIEQRRITQQALVIAKEQAESANEARGQFLANMSHEIRTPMNAIIGLCYIVLKSDLTSYQRNYLSKVHSSARSLLGLINDILDFSKIESGKFNIEQIEFDMDEVLCDLSQMIMPKAGEKELDILYSVDADVPYKLKGDPFRLGQILLNLINNAIKFTEKGEILVKIKLAEQKTAERVTLLFSVKDTGVGIRESAIGQLFSSFTQADSSMSRKYGGTGLGLAICKNLVKMMDGQIWVESELNKGSTFYFTAQFEMDEPEQFDRFIIPEEFSGINVMIVDDSETSRAVYSEMMASFDFNVTALPGSQQAIETLRNQPTNNPFELVFMDWKMPDMDGITAAKIIKTDDSVVKKPSIILISAYAQDDEFIEAEQYLDAYLLKPICQSVLYDCIVGIFCQVPRKSYVHFSCESIRLSVASQYAGRKILLVEDNKTNQEVAINLLSEVQLSVDSAFNGKEAIDKLANNRYDLVLMDVQMPEMDGITATKRIRADLNIKIPIVAMTAHAMQGDKDRCLAAGMDDYITKPIDVEHFYHTLGKWLAVAAKITPAAIPATVPVEMQAAVPVAIVEPQNIAKPTTRPVSQSALETAQTPRLPEFPGIDVKSALTRLIGNESLLLKLISYFKQHNEDKFAELKSALERNDTVLAREIVHAIKGEAGNIGANEVFTLASAMEKALADNDPAFTTLFVDLQPAILRVFKASELSLAHLAQLENDKIQLNELTNTAAKTGVVADSVEDLQVLLKEISQLLSKNNLKAKSLIERLSLHLSLPEFEFEHGQLNQCMSVLDFKGAQHQINALSEKMADKFTEILGTDK